MIDFCGPEGFGPGSSLREFDLTPCFQATIVSFLPQLFVILLGVPLLYKLEDSQPLPAIRRGGLAPRLLYASRLILGLSTFLASLVYLTLVVRDVGLTSYGYELLHAIGNLVANNLVFLIQILYYHRRFGSSYLLSIYWVAAAVAASMNIRTTFDSTPTWSLALQSIHLALYLLLSLVESIEKPLEPGAEDQFTPEEQSNFFSMISFWWMTSTMILGYRKPLEGSDLHRLNAADHSDRLYNQFGTAWAEQLRRHGHKSGQMGHSEAAAEEELDADEDDLVQVDGRSTPSLWSRIFRRGRSAGGQRKKKKKSRKRRPSVLWAVLSAYGAPFGVAAIFKLLQDLMSFVQPVLLRELLAFVTSQGTPTPQPLERGIYITMVMFGTALFQTFVLHQYFHRCFTTGMRVRVGLTAAIYRKALLLSSDARQQSTTGEVVNHMSVDAQRLQELTNYGHILWSGPFQIALSLYFLYEILGPAVFAGLAVLLLMIPINSRLAIRMRDLQKRQMASKDQRIRLMDEVLAGMRVIKLYAWENSFVQRIRGVRAGELADLRATASIASVQSLTWVSSPFFFSFVSFMVYVLTSPTPLTPEVAFVSLSLFNLLQFPLAMFPNVISSSVEAGVAITRLEDFFLREELDPRAVLRLRSEGIACPDAMPLGGGGADTIDATGAGEDSAIGSPLSLGPLSEAAGQPSQELETAGLLTGATAATGGARLTMGVSMAAGSDLESLSDSPTMTATAGGPGGESLAMTSLAGVTLLPDSRVVIEDGSFAWSQRQARDGTPTLQRVSLALNDASLMAVVGPVGSGKSSLIGAVLGDMLRVSGAVATQGRVAYVPQQAWILNATLRENILFGRPYDEAFYNSVVDACALRRDISILPGGDMTEIGEKGINLSGGQKQRVSLARAVYSQADIYLLDDPLSAVDSHVGRHIFERVIGPRGCLADRARLLVTHGIHYLRYCDQIVTMRGGRIVESGSYRALIDNGGLFARLVEEYGSAEAEDGGDASPGLMASDDEDNADTGGPSPASEPLVEEAEAQKAAALAAKPDADAAGAQLVEKETREVGDVKGSVYVTYMKAMGIWPTVLLLVSFLLTQAAQIGSSVWLSYWSEQRTTSNVWLYLGVYAALGVVMSLLTVASVYVSRVVTGLRAARLLHEKLLDRIFAVPMSFFDTTPLGRIVNRFSKDLNTIDQVLPNAIYSFLRTFAQVLAVLVVISYSTPYFLIAIIPLGVVYVMVQRFYVATSRELQRLESISRSPIYAHFGESLGGVSTIRAYCQEKRFIQANRAFLDINSQMYYPSISSNRWLAVRLECVGSLIVLLAALFAVLAGNTINASTVGLSLTYALSVTQTLNWMVRMSSDVESNIVSVERVNEYTELETEAPASIPETDPNANSPAAWPSAGAITFHKYSTRYRPGLDLVLRDISLAIGAREKIGVVGRTGAGKSSLTLALFRLIEAASGYIDIDQVDTSRLGLHDLRSRLSIIPQEPVLFGGSVRQNLDPFDDHTDEAVWAALHSAHIGPHIASLEGQLSAIVAQGGENFSVGQRQLICLGRALLRRSQILVLDEATAAVDVETDTLIQSTIRKEFAGCTIITIAHRLHTIMDSDRVLVLDHGRVAEFDSPQALLAQPGSSFFGMALDAGIVRPDGTMVGSATGSSAGSASGSVAGSSEAISLL
ncbi:hypothetical protein H696_02759 [Fonticula alba]|uniref:Uncharacterized protein n=1 Tax=Fonticula alba TaxID=691883 RepID=A0A058Z817_FONAL|nr:hypothetical protein H696_02759 [Fonticula alba]KCV70415.1 hypothetical protein H696_02759 [Fonticula alba]|eukprot:XP_009494931.1 hypothetical protein H696_02759 [Fonticula alba]